MGKFMKKTQYQIILITIFSLYNQTYSSINRYSRPINLQQKMFEKMSKPVINPDGSRRTRTINPQGLATETIIYPDGLIRETIVYPHGTKEENITYKSKDRTTTTTHTDQTKEILFYDENNQLTMRAITHSDGTIEHLYDADHNDYTIKDDSDSYSKINSYQIALHEAGHAIAIIFNYCHSVIEHVKIDLTSPTVYNPDSNAVRHTINRLQPNIKNIENNIILYLCGGIVEQITQKHDKTIDIFCNDDALKELICFKVPQTMFKPQDKFFALKMNKTISYINNQENIHSTTNNITLTSIDAINTYFKKISCSFDIANAYQSADEIINLKKLKLSSVEREQMKHKIIADMYAKAYPLIMNHIIDVIRIANALMKTGYLSGDEVYNLLDVDKPLTTIEALFLENNVDNSSSLATQIMQASKDTSQAIFNFLKNFIVSLPESLKSDKQALLNQKAISADSGLLQEID